MTTTPIRIRVLPRYPARILADTGIAAERRTTAPDITITSDYPSLGQTVIGDASMSFVKMYDATNAGYSVISVSQLLLGDPFGSNNVWTGTNAFNAGVTISGGITGTVPGNHTYSGNITFSGSVTLNGAVSINGATQFLDAAFTLADNADTSKKVTFELNRLSSATTRVLTVADRSFNVDGVARGYLYGLTLSNNVTDATNDIDIATGEAASDDAVAWNMILGSALTKRLDAAWAVGTNQGGLDTGSIANTTYHIFLIQRSDTGVVDALFSASATAPTMPANYDRKRRIGSIMRVAAAIRAFAQTGDYFQWSDPAADVNDTNPGTSALTPVMTVPLGIILQVYGTFYMATNVAASDQVIYISDPRSSNQPASATQYHTGIHRTTGAAMRSSGNFQVGCDTSGRIRYRISQSDANTVIRLFLMGWIDTRGRV